MEFNRHPVYICTAVCYTNLEIITKIAFDNFTITPYIVRAKRRGRKPLNAPPDPNINLKIGSIISLKLGSELRGVSLKKNDSNDELKTEGQTDGKVVKKRKPFDNTITMVLIIDNDGEKLRTVNIKIPRTGNIQMTGCRDKTQALKAVRWIWKHLEPIKESYTIQENGENEEKFFSCATFIYMNNISFNLGFHIDLMRLTDFINTCESEFIPIYNTTIEYAGVKIQKVAEQTVNPKFSRYEYRNGTWYHKREIFDKIVHLTGKKVRGEFPSYHEFPRFQDRYHTFLVFDSGVVTQSGMCPVQMMRVFYEFCFLLKNNQEEIETQMPIKKKKEKKHILTVDYDKLQNNLDHLSDSSDSQIYILLGESSKKFVHGISSSSCESIVNGILIDDCNK
jgi:hypothetical protein